MPLLVRMRRVRVLCVAQDRGRTGNNEWQRGRNGSSWVVSKSSADGFSGWSGSNDEESQDSQKKKWSGGNGSSNLLPLLIANFSIWLLTLVE